MKAHPVYKCKRCGKIEIDGQREVTSPEEIACVEQVTTHICDVTLYTNESRSDYINYEEIGIMELVGYNEIPE